MLQHYMLNCIASERKRSNRIKILTNYQKFDFSIVHFGIGGLLTTIDTVQKTDYSDIL